MADKYHNLDDLVNSDLPIRIEPDDTRRLHPERAGELAGSTVLHTKRGAVVVPEGAYRVRMASDAAVLEQCGVDDPCVQYSTYYARAYAIVRTQHPKATAEQIDYYAINRYRNKDPTASVPTDLACMRPLLTNTRNGIIYDEENDGRLI